MTTRAMPGTRSRSISNRFSSSSKFCDEKPVTLPRGRANSETAPTPTGSAIAPMTIGIVVVARLAARAAGVLQVTIASTGSVTSVAASAS
jgi:hypothetical protein